MTLDASRSLGIDSRSLDALRNDAAKDPKAATRQAAVQFESMFMSMVMKSMRDATMKADGGEGGASSSGQDNFTGMLDGQMAKQFAGRPQGLADMIEKQLTRHMQNLPAVSETNAAAAAAAAAAANAATAARPAAAHGAAYATNTATGTGQSRQAEFIQRMMPHAKAAEQATGVPASFILGQAALESGWGKGEIRNTDGTPSFNLFGVKAGAGWKGGTADARTTEYEGGQPVKQVARFRNYGSYTEAFSDYARMLSNHPRYSGVVRTAGTAESFAGGMQRAGYATDPQYAAKLARTINHTLALQRAMG
ncbi:MAG: flagellar assembly peptidoglycan hydrolase FlgJ [Burkholderiaceae bacterium]|nr:flagellar assembly peptidoglycan hydrolase FlgJ [Burkholderiaceae bacterium]